MGTCPNLSILKIPVMFPWNDLLTRYDIHMFNIYSKLVYFGLIFVATAGVPIIDEEWTRAIEESVNNSRKLIYEFKTKCIQNQVRNPVAI